MKSKACPSCGKVGSIKQILYGMPGPDFNYDKYIVGGCCVTGVDPRYGCTECDWSGFILKFPFERESALPSEFQCPSCGKRGTMRLLLSPFEYLEFEEKFLQFSKLNESDPVGNAACKSCGWSCIVQDMSAWANY